MGFQGALGLCCLGMMGYACVAVHRWRVGGMMGNGEVMEEGGVGTERGSVDEDDEDV